MAARAYRAHRAIRQPLAERLGPLRARAVARAQEEHARDRRRSGPPPPCLRRLARRETWMQRDSHAREQLAATREVEHVVGVAAVRCAASRRDQATVAQLAQVVGDEVLALARQLAQLAD